MNSNPRILIVDDETFLVELYCRVLSSELGFTNVMACSKSQDGLDALQSKHDLIITDMCREKGDSGLELIRAAQKAQPKTPILMASACSRKDMMSGLRDAKLQIQGVLVKPFKLPAFIEAICSALGRPVETVLRAAAKTGKAEAQYNLGKCCFQGEWMPRDMVEAAIWFEKAANQDYAPAQYQLGGCYLEGLGLKKHIETGVRWLRKAAKHKNVAAMIALGHYYRQGRGVEQNDLEAYVWFGLARRFDLPEAASDYAKLAPHLSNKNLAVAKSRINGFAVYAKPRIRKQDSC